MEVLKQQNGGFDFSNASRNATLNNQQNMQPAKFTKTGTTILGFHFKEGLIIAADTRATAGSTVADKNCMKVERVADNIYICGAGTAADCSHVKGLLRSQLELMRLN